MANLPVVPTLDANGNLSRYLQDIRKFPMLSVDEEYMLAKRWREHDDVDAAHQLVTSHLRLVAKMAGDQLMSGIDIIMLAPTFGEHIFFIN